MVLISVKLDDMNNRTRSLLVGHMSRNYSHSQSNFLCLERVVGKEESQAKMPNNAPGIPEGLSA